MPNETFGPQNTRTVITKVCASSNNPKLGRRGNFEMRSGEGVGEGQGTGRGGRRSAKRDPCMRQPRQLLLRLRRMEEDNII